jgi:uncharacterized membrane protein
MIEMVKELLSAVKIGITAVFIALVCICTMIFSIYVPATKGYFNVGEVMVYTTAILFGPVIGAVAGGVGSALADVFLGYGIYVPATLSIKACEGAVVGLLGRRVLEFNSRKLRKFAVVIGLFFSLLIGYIGTRLYTGNIEATIGLPFFDYYTFSVNIPTTFWIIITILIGTILTYVELNFRSQIGWMVFSMLIGGSIMVSGYFLYQWFLYGPAALIEIPINIGQSLIGILISVPLIKAIWKRAPWIKETFH